MRLSRLALGIALACPLSARADTTVEIPQPGGGYVQQTTNDQGDVVREVHMDESRVTTSTTEVDPETGNTTETTYENGKPKSSTTKDPEGRVVEEKTWKDGKLASVKTRKPRDDGTIDEDEIFYDGDGRVSQRAQGPVNAQGEATGPTLVDTYEYYEDGKLKTIRREITHLDLTGETLVMRFDRNGNLIESDGGMDDVFDPLPGDFDPRTHVTRDTAGNTVVVRHNEDGTFSVTVISPTPGVPPNTQHLRALGGCYLGDGCPFPGTGLDGQAPVGAGPGGLDHQSRKLRTHKPVVDPHLGRGNP